MDKLHSIIYYPISHHLEILINIIMLPAVPCGKHKVTYRITDFHKHNLFTSILTTIDGSTFLNSNDTNVNYSRCFPNVTKFTSTNRLPNSWLTQGIHNSIKHKCNLLKMHQLGAINPQMYKLPQHINPSHSNSQTGRRTTDMYQVSLFSTTKIWQTISERKGKQQLKVTVNSFAHNGCKLVNLHIWQRLLICTLLIMYST